MSNIEELVNETIATETTEEPKKEKKRPGRPEKEKAPEPTPAAKTDPLQPVGKEIITQQEIERRRDILVSVAVLGQLQDYVGENIPPAKIRLMPVDRLNSLFAVSQAKLRQELTFDTMDAVVSMAVKGLSFLMTFDDNEALKQYLLKNKGLQQILGKQAAGVSEKYGDFVAFGRIYFDVFKHVEFPQAPEPQAVASHVPEGDKKEN